MSSQSNLESDPDRAATILLVDDDPGILESVAALLTLAGYHVVTADDGTTALPLVETYLPDVIVSDITMHHMNGYDLFEAVRSNPNWMAIPFIFLSARTQPPDLLAGLHLGVDGYIPKPFATADLIQAIDTRLHRARQIASATQVDLERFKQEILTALSHELRTPLTYIIGYVTLLDEHRHLPTEAVDDMLTGIKRGADRLQHLVEDLTLVLRIDNGVVEAEINEMAMPCNLAALLQEAAHPYLAEAQQRNMDILLEVRDDVTCYGLSYYLKDAFRRLLDNAMKFSKREGGTIRIGLEQQNEHAVISVADSGIGISAAQQRQIFERMRQINRAVYEQQGIGLGLTIAQSLVYLHGGQIEVESTPGEGSTFRIRLPVMNSLPSVHEGGRYPRRYRGGDSTAS